MAEKKLQMEQAAEANKAMIQKALAQQELQHKEQLAALEMRVAAAKLHQSSVEGTQKVIQQHQDHQMSMVHKDQAHKMGMAHKATQAKQKVKVKPNK